MTGSFRPKELVAAFTATEHERSQVQGFCYGKEAFQMVIRDLNRPPNDDVVWRKTGLNRDYEYMHELMVEELKVVKMGYVVDHVMQQRALERGNEG